VFCKSCEPICEPEIVLKNFAADFQANRSLTSAAKMRKETLSCIGNFEENMDLSRIYLAVLDCLLIVCLQKVLVGIYPNDDEYDTI
jgi:hypothetical protein